MRRIEGRPYLWRRVWAGVTLMGLVLFGLPSTSVGQLGGAPTIEFLNPSSFANAGSADIIVSDRQPTRPSNGTNTYRLSAWVGNAPADSGVEFELLSAGVSLDTFDSITQVGQATFEHRWNIPDTLPDGPYTMRATLFENNEAVASVDQSITVVRLADRAELLYPTTDPASSFPGGGGFGTFHPLGPELVDGETERPLPVGNLDATHTKQAEFGSGTTRVRAFYTTSAPGTVPEWIVCGTEKTNGHPVPSSAAHNGVRCTLNSVADQTKVTAVAVLANSSPGDYDPAANQAGDVVRVLNSYAQVPVSFDIVSGDGEVLNEMANGSFPCHTVTVRLADQAAREIVAANIDVHGTGPTDKLRFDTGFAPAAGVKEADRHHILHEPGFDCFGENDPLGGLQSEHQLLGQPDMKHIEADPTGTDDTGEWGFSFKVPADQATNERFTFHYSMFVDEEDDGCHANDDRLTSGELFRAGSIGLGAAPEPARSPTVFGLEICGAPPPPPPDDLLPRTVDIDVSDKSVKKGKSVRFFGQIESQKDRCESIEVVKLKTRNRKGKEFQSIAQGRTDVFGNYEFRKVNVSRTRQYRALAPSTGECKRTRSKVVTVRATR